MIITVTVREMTVAKVTRMMRELRVKVKYHYQMKFKLTLESSKRMEPFGNGQLRYPLSIQGFSNTNS